MNQKSVRIALITILAIAALYFAYRLAFIRTVNYEIGGIKIPSKYNTLTGKAVPITDYKGKEPVRSVEDKKSGASGLDTTQLVSAKIRWAVFEEWVEKRPQYSGWDSNPDIFKKAQEDFLAHMAKSGRKIQVVK